MATISTTPRAGWNCSTMTFPKNIAGNMPRRSSKVSIPWCAFIPKQARKACCSVTTPNASSTAIPTIRTGFTRPWVAPQTLFLAFIPLFVVLSLTRQHTPPSANS
jgi:hypothetical protein